MEERIIKKVLPRFLDIDNLILMGNHHLPKVPIFAFVIKAQNGKLLHPNFVTQLLGDLFGIQTRSGCSCAGMFGAKLLNAKPDFMNAMINGIFKGYDILKMGFSRLNFSYFFTDDDIEYILQAVDFVARYGFMFLPNYTYELKRGLFISKDEQRFES